LGLAAADELKGFYIRGFTVETFRQRIQTAS
jgi:hypothetical protein